MIKKKTSWHEKIKKHLTQIHENQKLLLHRINRLEAKLYHFWLNGQASNYVGTLSLEFSLSLSASKQRDCTDEKNVELLEYCIIVNELDKRMKTWPKYKSLCSKQKRIVSVGTKSKWTKILDSHLHANYQRPQKRMNKKKTSSTKETLYSFNPMRTSQTLPWRTNSITCCVHIEQWRNN